MRVATVVLGVLLGLLSITSAADPEPVSATIRADRPQSPSYTYTGFTEDHDEVVRWALGLFDEAGLELPSIDFVASVGTEPCRGRIGIARHDDRGSEITICGERIGPGYDIMVLHELAHAWEKHYATAEARQAFLDLRGLSDWRSGDWHDRGAEHAASIIAWGLVDRPTIPGHLEFDGCDELIEGYRTIVGVDPLHGFTDKCDA